MSDEKYQFGGGIKQTPKTNFKTFIEQKKNSITDSISRQLFNHTAKTLERVSKGTRHAYEFHLDDT